VSRINADAKLVKGRIDSNGCYSVLWRKGRRRCIKILQNVVVVVVMEIFSRRTITGMTLISSRMIVM
jgi:hypothetical protein